MVIPICFLTIAYCHFSRNVAILHDYGLFDWTMSVNLEAR